MILSNTNAIYKNKIEKYERKSQIKYVLSLENKTKEQSRQIKRLENALNSLNLRSELVKQVFEEFISRTGLNALHEKFTGLFDDLLKAREENEDNSLNVAIAHLEEDDRDLEL